MSVIAGVLLWGEVEMTEEMWDEFLEAMRKSGYLDYLRDKLYQTVNTGSFYQPFIDCGVIVVGNRNEND